MRWISFSIVFLVLFSPSAWAQLGAEEANAAFYRKLIKEANEVNAALTASNERLAKALEGYRKEVRLLRSDRGKFDAERKSVADRVTQLKAQIAVLRRQASELYRRNVLYLQEYTRMQREWTTDSHPPLDRT